MSEVSCLSRNCWALYGKTTEQIDSIKEAMAPILQDLSRPVNKRIFWWPLLHRVAIGWKQLDST